MWVHGETGCIVLSPAHGAHPFWLCGEGGCGARLFVSAASETEVIPSPVGLTDYRVVEVQTLYREVG